MRNTLYATDLIWLSHHPLIFRWLTSLIATLFIMASPSIYGETRASTQLNTNRPGHSDDIHQPEAVEYQYPETRELVRFVKAAADAIRREGEMIFPDFRQPDSRWFHGDRYLFVWNLHGNRYVYPPDPANEKGNMAGLKDINGKPIGRMFIDVVSGPSREGWVHYQWYQPNAPEPTWKSTYLIRADAPSGKRYLVGSGEYNLKVERVFVVDAVNRAATLLQQAGKEAFTSLRDKSSPFFFHDTYVFVTSADGIELVNPAFPALEGRSLMDTRDVNGKLLVREYINAAEKQGSAWVSYYWPRPGQREPVRKLTYVKKVSVENEILIVGAGIYEPEKKEGPAE